MRVFAVVMCLLVVSPLPAEEVFFYDFEQGDDLAAYEGLNSRNARMEIVAETEDGEGHCLRLSNLQASRYCTLEITLPIEVQRNLVLSFDHRAEIAEDQKAAYLGILFFDENDKQWFGRDEFSPHWRRAEIVLGNLHSPNDGVLTLGKILHRVSIYGRAEEESQAEMTVWLDNIRLETRETVSQFSNMGRVSYANPPFFNWPRGEGVMQLEYAPDPEFPAETTVSVETTRNYHMPSEPLEPGTWYWRVLRRSALADAWTETQYMEILPKSHRFTTPPILVAEITARPHPRLSSLREVPEGEKAAYIAQARSLAQQGVPDDPPPYEPGNPDWPTWIDWYGKVHGGITSATGVRLRRMSEYYIRTRSPEVRELLKEMAFKAARWDPEGGSAMHRGDIGAHHFLRGLNWCYDALHDDLDDNERELLRGAIVTRAGQFWHHLNPFRLGREYNNHAWLCAYGLAESGLLLLGEHAEAQDWAEYVRQLYLGLFLCGLGRQGENNEGIAYWGYGLMFVLDYADMMKLVCDIDMFQHPWLNQTARFPMYTAIPDAYAVSFANTGKPNHGVMGPSQATHVRRLALRTHDPYALWYAGPPFDGADFDPKPPLDLPQSVHYEFIGWALHNTSLLNGADGVTFAMRSGPFWAGHQHEDQNGFVIHAYGEKLAIDSGYYDWYGSEHFKGWSTLTRAHNAILVDGLDQDSRKRGADGRIATWFDTPACGYTVGDASNPMLYQGKLSRWDRRALFLKPGFVIIHDLLAAARAPVQYDWLLHAVAPVEVDPATQGFHLISGKAALRGRFIAPADLGFEVVKGYPVEPVDGYSTRPVPPERYTDEWTLWATPREKRRDEDFLTALQIMRTGEGDEAEFIEISGPGAIGVECRLPDARHVVVFRRREAEENGQSISGGRLETDGEMAAVSYNALGQVSQAVLIGGTFLRQNGETVIQATAPIHVSLLKNSAGTIVNAALDQPGVLTIPGEQPRQVVFSAPDSSTATVDGAGVKLTLPAGDSEILLDPTESGKSVVIERNGLSFEGHSLIAGDEVTRYWHTVFEVPEANRYQFTVNLPASETCRLWIDNRPLALDGHESRQARIWLTEGRHLLLLSGPAELPEIIIEAQGSGFANAQMLPKEYAPAADAVLIEAEEVAAEGTVKGIIMDKVGASGGIAHCVWDTPGQWAEWLLPVPRDGEYRLVIRGCSEHSNVLRTVDINPGAADEQSFTIRMQATEGWARTTDDWRYFALSGPDGAPVRLRLSAGQHRLRMEQLGGSMNLDLFALEPLQ